jgi:acyl carrier protein
MPEAYPLALAGTWPDGFVDILRRHAAPDQQPVELGDETSFADLGVDSMAFLGVLTDVEQLAGVEIDVEALTPEAFASPRGLWGWLETRTPPLAPPFARPGADRTGPVPADDGWVPVMPSKQVVFAQGHGSVVRTAADLIVRVYRLDGELDVDRLVGCIARLRAANDALRLAFRDDGGTGCMRVRDARSPVPISFLHLVHCADADLTAYLRLLSRTVARGWDPAADGSARWTLLRLSPTRHLLATWYAHVSVDVRSVSDLERQLWAAYHENEGAIEQTGSFLDCARRRRQQPERCAPRFWAAESNRVPAETWDATGLSATREHRRRVSPADLAALRARVEGGEKLSLAQLLAHRFALAIRAVTRAEAFVVHHFVDERTPSEQHVAGALSGLVPVVFGPGDLGPAQATARRTVRALASRPRRPGGELPAGYLRLLTQVRAYSFTYVPWRGNSVQRRFDLDVTEFPVHLEVRDPARGRLRVVELEHGGIELGLMVHPDEMSDDAAADLLEHAASDCR